MKRIFLFIAIIFASFHVFAQESLVKVSPFHFIDGTFNLSYEKSFSTDNSILFSGGFNLAENGDEYGWMGELQLRKYVFRPNVNSSSSLPLSGIYTGLYGNGKYFVQQYQRYYDYWDVEPYYEETYDENGQYVGSTYVPGEGYEYRSENIEYEIKQIEAGIIMGFQLLFSDKISLDLFVGGGLRSSQIDNKPEQLEFYSPERGYTGIVPKIGFDVGLSF